MDRGRELGHNVLLIGAGRLFSQGAAFLLLPIYTRFLQPSEYGLLDLVLTYVTVLIPVILIQIDRGAFRFVIDAKSQSDLTRIISSAVQIVLAAMLAVLVLLSIAYLIWPKPILWLAYAAIVTGALSSFAFQVARGFGKNGLYAIGNIFQGLTLLGAVVASLTLTDSGVAGVLSAYALANLAAATIVMVKLKLWRHLKRRGGDPATRRGLLRYSLPLVPSNLSWWFIGSADRTLVTIFLGTTATGILGISAKYASILAAVYAVFDMAWTESASRHISATDRDRFFESTLNGVWRLFGAAALCFIAVMPFIFDLILPYSYQEARGLFPIQVISGLLASVVSSISAVYIALQLTKRVLSLSLGAAVVSVSLNLVLIPIVGIYGALISSLTAFGLMTVSRYFDIQKWIRFRYSAKVLAILAVGFAGVLLCYYNDSTAARIIGLGIALSVSGVLNWRTIQGRLPKRRP